MHSSAFSGVRCIELAALKQLRPRPYTRTQFLRKGFCLALKGPNRFLTEHHREKQFKPQHEKRGRFCTSLARGRSSPGPPHKHTALLFVQPSALAPFAYSILTTAPPAGWLGAAPSVPSLHRRGLAPAATGATCILICPMSIAVRACTSNRVPAEA